MPLCWTSAWRRATEFHGFALPGKEQLRQSVRGFNLIGIPFQRVSVSAFQRFPLSAHCPPISAFSFQLSAFALMNEVSVSQQLARCDRHFLHAGNNPERANAAQAPAPLGASLRLTPFHSGSMKTIVVKWRHEYAHSATDPAIKSSSPKSANSRLKSLAFAGFWWEAPPI